MMPEKEIIIYPDVKEMHFGAFYDAETNVRKRYIDKWYLWPIKIRSTSASLSLKQLHITAYSAIVYDEITLAGYTFADGTVFNCELDKNQESEVERIKKLGL